MQLHSKKSASQNKTQAEVDHFSSEEKLRPLTKDLSIRSMRFKSSLVFAIAGAAGLAITQYLDLSRYYWVVMTIALLLLRENVSITFRYIISRIVGTILGAIIAYVVIATVHNQWILELLLFLFVATYDITRGISYLLSTLSLCSFSY